MLLEVEEEDSQVEHYKDEHYKEEDTQLGLHFLQDVAEEEDHSLEEPDQLDLLHTRPPLTYQVLERLPLGLHRNLATN